MSPRPRMTRQEAQLLLPFAANDTLTPDEAAGLAEWLAQDGDLRQEAAFLAALRSRMQAAPLPETGAEFGLARLMRSLPAQEGSAQDGPGQAGLAHPAPKAPLRRLVWPALAASVAALVSALGTAALMSRPPTEPVLYEQASGDVTDLPTLTVRFAEGAVLADLEALLQQHDLLIVDGPGALGLYRLELPPGADALAMAETLRAAQTLVLSVDDPQ